MAFLLGQILKKVCENDQRLNRIESLLTEILRAVENGSVEKRYYPIDEAEFYCGIRSKDRQHRKFIRFVEEEGITAKMINTGSDLVFDRFELDEAMARNREEFD
ncbi:hypothetical protein QEH53_00680 [Pelagicoccus sp. SDUM812002]|nr:hypothetical protein [Pelagicoccus sp. SDUM812002]